MPRLKNAQAYQNASLAEVLKTARTVVDEELQRSTVLSKDALDALPTFEWSEIVPGRVLGRGGFCVVRECSSIRLNNSALASSGASLSTVGSSIRDKLMRKRSSSLSTSKRSTGKFGSHAFSSSSLRDNSGRDSSVRSSGNNSLKNGSSHLKAGDAVGTTPNIEEEVSEEDLDVPTSVDGPSSSIDKKPSGDQMQERREHLARRVWAKKGGKYCVKQVESDFFHNDRVTYLKGVIDLALETYYLASLSHPHVLGLCGLSSSGPFEDVGYFLILEQLQQILSQRLTAWMHQLRATKGITGALTGGRRKINSLLIERLLVAYDVADALDYLHSRRIIFRDLKPDNIGFDVEGTLKIFDFGLAKELVEDEQNEDGLYNMTGFTGAVRYMAPEVGLRKPYNHKGELFMDFSKDETLTVFRVGSNVLTPPLLSALNPYYCSRRV